MSIKQPLKLTRSREDEQLYSVIINYDPAQYLSLQMTVSMGQLVLAGATILVAKMKSDNLAKCENQQNSQKSPKLVEMFTNMSVCVQWMCNQFVQQKTEWYLKENKVRKRMIVLKVRQCQHEPAIQTLLNYEGKSTIIENQAMHDICKHCNKILWMHYNQKKKQITLQNLISYNPSVSFSRNEEVEWTIILNQHFTSKTVIANILQRPVYLPFNGKATFLINWCENKLTLETIVIIIKEVICKHQKIQDEVCQFCLQTVKIESLPKLKNYLFQFDNESAINPAQAHGGALLHQQQLFIDNILKQQKAIMILDLDNTILHSIEMSHLALQNILQLKEYYLILKLDPTCPGQKDYIIVKMRPFFKHFIYEMSKIFEIYVYTKGTRVYADRICQFIRAQYADEPLQDAIKTWPTEPFPFLKLSKCFKLNRIISRNEDSDLEKKSLENILPTKKNYHLILDDRRDVWDNSPSWFYTREYYYFYRQTEIKADKNQQQSFQKSINKCKNPLQKLQQVQSEILMGKNPISIQKNQSKLTQINQQRQKEDISQEEQIVLQKTLSLQKRKQLNQVQKYIQGFDKNRQQQSQECTLKLKLIEEYKSINKVKTNSIKIISRKDYFLLFAMEALRRIHRKFFEQKNNINQVSIHSILNKIRAQFLFKVKVMVIVQNYLTNNAYRRVGKLGAILIHPHHTQIPDIVVRPNSIKLNSTNENEVESQNMKTLGKEKQKLKLNGMQILSKLKYYHNLGIPVISESYINACYEYTYPFQRQPFVIDNACALEVNLQPFEDIIEKTAVIIRQESQKRMQKQFES